MHDDSCDCCASEERREGGGGVVRRDGGGGEVETYSSIQLIKIPLSKKPVKFRYVTCAHLILHNALEMNESFLHII